MVIFAFWAGGPTVFENIGVAPGLRRNGGDLRGTALFTVGLLSGAALMSNSFPYLLPLSTLVIHFFPDLLTRGREWLMHNWVVLVLVVSFLVLSFYPEDNWDEEDWERQQQQQREPKRRRSGQHYPTPREYSQAQSHHNGVDGFDGSWGGSVVADFSFTMFLILATFLLPHLWSMLNTWVLRVIPEERRATWWQWTEFVRPTSPAPGSVPTSRQAIDKLENVVLGERHLLAENSPNGIVCPVCLDHMKIGDHAKRLPCKHFFHGCCVLPWLEKHNSCPTCRYELETSDSEYEYWRQERQQEQIRRNNNATTNSPSANTAAPAPARASAPAATEPARASAPAATEPARASTTVSDSMFNSAEYGVEYTRLLGLSVMELKNIARQRNINIVGCVEKHELVNRILSGRPGAPLL